MIGICKNCSQEFKYAPSQSYGLFCSNKCQGQYSVKQRYKEGTVWKQSMGVYLKSVREHKCECCGITEWNGKPITLQVDHNNGDRTDNRYENLKIVCPNCHSQTETWGSKNISEDGRKRLRLAQKKSMENRNKKLAK